MYIKLLAWCLLHKRLSAEGSYESDRGNGHSLVQVGHLTSHPSEIQGQLDIRAHSLLLCFSVLVIYTVLFLPLLCLPSS